ncbi:MAG: asparaginase [Pseudomonadota bacterium]
MPSMPCGGWARRHRTGAWGACIAVVPELGMGLALKGRDGAVRAARASLAAIVRDTLAIEPGAVPELDFLAGPPITNTNKTAVGQIQVIL